jgi:hypothetical protein
MLIILADAERVYVRVLQEQLAARLPECRFWSCCALDEWPDGDIQAKSREGLCLFNPLDFPDLPRRFSANGESFHCMFWSVQPGSQCGEQDCHKASQQVQLIRLGTASAIAGQISKWLASAAAHSTGEPDQQPGSGLAKINAELPAVNQESAGSWAGTSMMLLLCLDACGYRPDISRLRLRELTGSGRRVVYLPIMPTYQMACLSAPGQGPSLSDLMLRIFSRVAEPGEIGQYLQPTPDGFFQFRPPDRSDDLVVCSPDLLRDLVLLLRRWMTASPCTILIDCAGIALASVSCLAVLCDSCEFCLPEKDDFASVSARREISYLLGLLPASCMVRECAPGKFLSPVT